MYCVVNGKVCVQKYHVLTRRWVYIRESRWLAMSAEERACYVDDVAEARMIEDFE